MKKECAGSALFLLAGVYGVVSSLQLPMGYLREPGPGMLPFCISVLLCLSGILGLIYGIKKANLEKIDWRAIVRKLVTPLKIVGTTAAFILAVEQLGYFLASTSYLILLFFWVSRYRLWMSIGLSLFVGVGSWYFFGNILSVPLPKGLFSP